MFRSLRISHVEFRFPGSEKLGPSRNGRMERNFPVIPIFRNFWSNGKRPNLIVGNVMQFCQVSVYFSQNCLNC